MSNVHLTWGSLPSTLLITTLAATLVTLTSVCNWFQRRRRIEIRRARAKEISKKDSRSNEETALVVEWFRQENSLLSGNKKERYEFVECLLSCLRFQELENHFEQLICTDLLVELLTTNDGFRKYSPSTVGVFSYLIFRYAPVPTCKQIVDDLERTYSDNRILFLEIIYNMYYISIACTRSSFSSSQEKLSNGTELSFEEIPLFQSDREIYERRRLLVSKDRNSIEQLRVINIHFRIKHIIRVNGLRSTNLGAPNDDYHFLMSIIPDGHEFLDPFKALLANNCWCAVKYSEHVILYKSREVVRTVEMIIEEKCNIRGFHWQNWQQHF